MIALLFALVTAAMVLAYFGRKGWSKLVFAGTFLLAMYWLSFHATSSLGIQL